VLFRSPLRAVGRDFVDTGIGEQAALQDFLAANFPDGGDAPFDQPELATSLDSRIQFLDERTGTLEAPALQDGLTFSLAETFQGESDPDDEDSPEGAS